MDRLQALIGAALVIASVGCDDTTTPAGAPPSRVEAVVAEREDAAQELCDVAPSGSGAPMLAFPELASGTAPATHGPRWLNVWATWCQPCVEEMPMIVGWSERLEREGAEVELVFLSSDESEEAVASFRQAHASAPETLRMRDPGAISQWATSVGLDPGATLPIHVFTDAAGRVRCARTGALSERDYEHVRGVVTELAAR